MIAALHATNRGLQYGTTGIAKAFPRFEMRLFAETGTGVAHCPTSNMRLGSGIALVGRMLDLGVKVGLAVDGSASNDSSHVSEEWVEDRAADWGVGSPLYQSRVMGEFADAGEGVLYPLALLEDAMGCDVDTDHETDALGVDV